MNREQWQQKRGHAGAPGVTTAITVAEIVHRVNATAVAAGAERPAAGVGEQAPAAVSVVAVRRSKP